MSLPSAQELTARRLPGSPAAAPPAPTEDIPAPDTGDGAADGPAQSSPEEDHYGYEIPAGELPPGY